MAVAAAAAAKRSMPCSTLASPAATSASSIATPVMRNIATASWCCAGGTSNSETMGEARRAVSTATATPSAT